MEREAPYIYGLAATKITVIYVEGNIYNLLEPSDFSIIWIWFPN